MSGKEGLDMRALMTPGVVIRDLQRELRIELGHWLGRELARMQSRLRTEIVEEETKKDEVSSCAEDVNVEFKK